MSRRVPLWIAFVLVHVVVSALGHVLPSQPMGDVYNVYEPWSARALAGSGIVGVTEPWVYPQLALVPLVLAWAFAWVGSYTAAWAVFVAVCDAVAFAILVGRGRSRGRRAAAWLWLAAMLLLGPVGVYRLDAVTVPLAIIGCLWLVGRPWLGATLLAIATWIKVWPAALVAAAVIALRRRVTVIGAASLVSAATLALVVLAGGAAVAFGFIGGQTGRGLQVEAPVSTVYVWQTMLGVPGASIFYNADIITFEVTGPSWLVVSAAMTPVLVLAVVLVAVAGAVKAWRGASFAALFPTLALTLVLAFIVTNKVGSPQYMTWLVPPLLVGVVLERRRWAVPAALVLVVSGLTQLIYPVYYDALLMAQLGPVVVLTARNILVVALFLLLCVRLARVPVGRPARSRSLTPAE